MASSTASFDIGLAPQSLFSLADAARVTIRCRRGSVWITLDGEPDDIVIEAGDSFETPLHRRALLYGLRPSCVSLTAAPEPQRRAAPTRLVLEQLLA